MKSRILAILILLCAWIAMGQLAFEDAPPLPPVAATTNTPPVSARRFVPPGLPPQLVWGYSTNSIVLLMQSSNLVSWTILTNFPSWQNNCDAPPMPTNGGRMFYMMVSTVPIKARQ